MLWTSEHCGSLRVWEGEFFCPYPVPVVRCTTSAWAWRFLDLVLFLVSMSLNYEMPHTDLLSRSAHRWAVLPFRYAIPVGNEGCLHGKRAKQLVGVQNVSCDSQTRAFVLLETQLPF